MGNSKVGIDEDLENMRIAMKGWTIQQILPGQRRESDRVFVLEKNGVIKKVHLHANKFGTWISL